MLVPKSLQNKSDWDTTKPDIVITPDMTEWETVYTNWIQGKNPTNSPLWKQGVVLTLKVEEVI